MRGENRAETHLSTQEKTSQAGARLSSAYAHQRRKEYPQSSPPQGAEEVDGLKKEHRLRKNAQIRKVREEGRSWAHPLLALCALRNDLEYSRFGFSVSRWIGGAVIRNRVKRLVREATRLRLEGIAGGWDLVFIARDPIQSADFHQVDRAVGQLLRHACLLKAADREVENCPAVPRSAESVAQLDAEE